MGAFAPVNIGYTPPIAEKSVENVAANGYNRGTSSPPPMYPQNQQYHHHHQQQQPYTPSTQTHIPSPASQYTELDPSSSTTTPAAVSPSRTYLSTSTNTNTNMGELGGGENRLSYQAYHPPQPLNYPPSPIPGMSSGGGGSSDGGINRRPIGGAHRPAVDMNGHPLSENFRPHELP
jgi:hypothetical protein